MIPKTIHCIWLGKGSLPCRSSAFIKLWKRKLPDYTIKIWNEDNLPITEECSRNKYLRECYKRKLYAFVSDYFRLWILFNYGGIYLDTDVEILNSFDSLLTSKGFMGFEAGNAQIGEYIGSGIIGAERGNKTIKKLLSFYKHEVWHEKEYVNTIIFKKLYLRDPSVFDDIKIYSRGTFSPYSPYDINFPISNNTYTIHWYSTNWGLSLKGYIFLTTKYLRNPLEKNIIKIKRTIGYIKRKKINA